MSKADLTVVVKPIHWPEEVTNETKEMRPSFQSAWKELSKVAERKAPITDLTKVHMAIAALYIKRQGSEIHEKALLMMAARGRINNDNQE